ncbi:MAG: Spy/CpxP family protein refolding chaperone [Thermodesulfobacteriota bacterium]
MANKKWIMTGIAVLAILAAAAAGCRHHATPEQKMDRVMEFLFDDLNLTPEQQEILDDSKADILVDLKSMRSAHRRAREEIMAQIGAEVMDQERVLEAIAGVRTEIDGLISLAVSRLADFHKTLTVEQKQQLVEKLESLRKLHCGAE